MRTCTVSCFDREIRGHMVELSAHRSARLTPLAVWGVDAWLHDAMVGVRTRLRDRHN